jgi:hypothetical protein
MEGIKLENHLVFVEYEEVVDNEEAIGSVWGIEL